MPPYGMRPPFMPPGAPPPGWGFRPPPGMPPPGYMGPRPGMPPPYGGPPSAPPLARPPPPGFVGGRGAAGKREDDEKQRRAAEAWSAYKSEDGSVYYYNQVWTPAWRGKGMEGRQGWDEQRAGRLPPSPCIVQQPSAAVKPSRLLPALAWAVPSAGDGRVELGAAGGVHW